MTPVSFVIPFYNDDTNFDQFFDQNYTIIKSFNMDNEIILVDDTKNERLLKTLSEKYPDVILITHLENKGFSISINDGVNKAGNEIVFLLNSDILLSQQTIEHTIKHFEDEKIFAVTLKSVYPEGRIREGAKSFHWKGGLPKVRHSPRHYPKPDSNGIIHSYYAVGGHCALRKSMFVKLNGMDHKTFHPFYWEDTDLSIRAKKQGWKIVYEPTAEVQHPPENSSIAGNFNRKFISEIKFRNRVFFGLKNYPEHKAGITFFLYVRFIQKLFKFQSVSSAFKNSVGLIKEFKKLSQ